MKAMVLKRPRNVDENPLEWVNAPIPLPLADQVRIQVRVCGICHTDLHTVEGEIALPKLPVIPGHQIVGVVESLGQAATRFRIGDRVGVPWLNWADGTCEFCERGEENLCDQARFTGQHVDGGYAEYIVVHENFVYHLPENFSDPQAAPFLCGGVIGYRALILAGVQTGDRVGLYGFGNSAHIVLQFLRHWGCTVYVFTRRAEHRALAQTLGATWVGHADDAPPKLLDRAIIFAPAGELVPAALRVLRKGGTVTLAGIYSTPIPTLAYETLYHERVIRTVANSTRQDASEMLLVAAEIPVQTQVEIFPLHDANRALQMLKRSEIRGAGVLLISE